MKETSVFNNKLYLSEQMKAFNQRLENSPVSIIEFGGKPGNDLHASRVLPGYNPDIKSEIIRQLQEEWSMSVNMVVNFRDIVPSELGGRYPKGRIRGDSGLFYKDEVIRLVDHLAHRGVKVNGITLSIIPVFLNQDQETFLNNVINQYKSLNLEVYRHYEIPEYPSLDVQKYKLYESVLSKSDAIVEDNSLLLISPGGGSGKFGVAYIEILRQLLEKSPIGYIKFETFPVFNLPPDHLLNRAFEAATCDLSNKVIEEGGSSTYDKDKDNFNLLLETWSSISSETVIPKDEMAVNRIESGILDMESVERACREEIVRRYIRYSQEVKSGLENQETVNRLLKLLC